MKKNKDLIEMIEIGIIFLLIAIGFIVIAETGHDIKKRITEQSIEIAEMQERIEKLER